MRISTSSDGGKSFGKAVDLPATDPLGRCGVAILKDGKPVVCWLDLVDNVAVVVVSRDGKKPVPVGKTAASRSAGVPEVVAYEDGAVVAWVDVSKRSVMTARVTW